MLIQIFYFSITLVHNTSSNLFFEQNDKTMKNVLEAKE